MSSLSQEGPTCIRPALSLSPSMSTSPPPSGHSKAFPLAASEDGIKWRTIEQRQRIVDRVMGTDDDVWNLAVVEIRLDGGSDNS